MAAFNGFAKTVLALIRVGASLDAADNVSSRCNTPVWVRTVPVTITVRYRAQNQQTALHFAAYKSQARVVTARVAASNEYSWRARVVDKYSPDE